jgi:hypothetical protein
MRFRSLIRMGSIILVNLKTWLKKPTTKKKNNTMTNRKNLMLADIIKRCLLNIFKGVINLFDNKEKIE